MNTLTLYFYQPTTSRRWGTIHVIDLHPPARFLIAATDRRPSRARARSRNIPHGSSIDLLDRSPLSRKKKKKNSKLDTLVFTKYNIYACKINPIIDWHHVHNNCCSCYRNLQPQRTKKKKKTISRHAKSITCHVRLLVVHAWARKDGNDGWVSGRRGSRPLQFTGARRFCRQRIRPAVGAADSRAPRAATAKAAATGTGPTSSLSLSLTRKKFLFFIYHTLFSSYLFRIAWERPATARRRSLPQLAFQIYSSHSNSTEFATHKLSLK